MSDRRTPFKEVDTTPRRTDDGSGGGEPPVSEAPASREEEVTVDAPAGVKSEKTKVNRQATAKAANFKSAIKAAAAVKGQTGDDADKAARMALMTAAMAAEKGRGEGNQYTNLQVWNKNKAAKIAGTHFNPATGVSAGEVRIPVDGVDHGWALQMNSKAGGEPQTVDEVLADAVGAIRGKYKVEVTPDVLRQSALDSLDEREVAVLREALMNDPEFSAGSVTSFADVDTLVRSKLLESKLMGNRALGQQVYFHGIDAADTQARNLGAIAAANDPNMDALIDRQFGKPGLAAWLRRNGGASAGGGNWMDQIGGWAQEKPQVYGGPLEKLNELQNWQHAAGGAGAAAGIAGLLAALGQPQQDDEAYRALLAAQNAAPSTSY
jgi:hypothetical protein